MVAGPPSDGGGPTERRGVGGGGGGGGGGVHHKNLAWGHGGKGWVRGKETGFVSAFQTLLNRKPNFSGCLRVRGSEGLLWVPGDDQPQMPEMSELPPEASVDEPGEADAADAEAARHEWGFRV